MNAVTPTTKGKKVSSKAMIESLHRVLKNWGRIRKQTVINLYDITLLN